MGKQDTQKELFSYQVDLDKRVRQDHPLREVRRTVDFSFVRERVSKCYGYNGNVSVDPEVIMKMMFLLFYDDVSSERELMRVIPERLDYMWFLGYGLDDEIPNHSVLSKARKRWGEGVFEDLFVRVVHNCIKAGLVDGGKIYVDASLVDANASKDSILKGSPELIEALKETYRRQGEKLEEKGNGYYEPVNRRMLSTTDPDAPVVARKKGESKPRYKSHRVVDEAKGVITAVESTAGDVKENGLLMNLVDQHERNTEGTVHTAVADSQYGTNENFSACHSRSIRSHMGDLRETQKGRHEGIFSEEEFEYDKESDTYRCPAGKVLTRRTYNKRRKAYEYRARKKTCNMCELRDRCTRSKTGGRSIKRHEDYEGIQEARAQSHRKAAKMDRIKRKWLMEGSFADAANNHGFKRARWRRLWNQKIQDYLIAAVQNVRILIKNMNRKEREASASSGVSDGVHGLIFTALCAFCRDGKGLSVPGHC